MTYKPVTSVQLFILFCLLLITLPVVINAQDMEIKKEKRVVLWVSGDRDVAEHSCLMYTHAAKRNGWFDEALQEKVKSMIKDGVILEACAACANQLGVAEELKALGIDVKGMGVPLTEYLKSGYHVLTY